MGDTNYIRCKRCNKMLKTEEARQRGYGPCCYKKLQKEIEEHQKDLFSLQKAKAR